jgi:hypothetical protein
MPKKPSPLTQESIEVITAEYNYIAQTAAQANEDRARVSSFYLVAVGSLIAALFGAQFFDPEKFNTTVKIMFGALFGLLTLLGVSTIIQLARLRAAWHDSMQAMSQIKKFMVERDHDLANAFLWKTETIPAKYKRHSISYYQAIEVAAIGGLMCMASVFCFELAILPAKATVNYQHWIIAFTAGVAMVFIQLQIYKRSLK